MQIDPDLRWDDLRVVLALCREGSLLRAAAALGVNISTVSRRLDALEERIDVVLFDRASDGTRPTPAAITLLPFAEAMEAAAIGFARGVDQFEREPRGEVRITAPPGFVDHFLAPALPELLRQHGELSVRLLSLVGYVDLGRREADIALRAQRPRSGDLVATRLVQSPWTIVASEAYAASLPRTRSLDTLRWVSWGAELEHLPDATWLRARVDPARICLASSSMTAQIEAVRAGIGAMVAPAPYAALDGMVELRVPKAVRTSLAQIPPGELWLACHRALRHVPRVAVTWEWLHQHFGGGPPPR